jgi:hypothetical protein
MPGPKGERRPRDVIGNAVQVMRIARVQSSRQLEREAGRNVEVMWLTGRVVPDHNTIVDFRKDNGRAIRQLCFLQAAALRVLANDTDKMVALLKGRPVAMRGLSQRPKNIAV